MESNDKFTVDSVDKYIKEYRQKIIKLMQKNGVFQTFEETYKGLERERLNCNSFFKSYGIHFSIEDSKFFSTGQGQLCTSWQILV